MPRRLLERENRLVTVVALVLIAVALSVSGVALLGQSHSQASTDREICIAINRLNRAISHSLERSKVNLPRVAYFRAHPGELRDQLREIEHTLGLFLPRTCH